MKSIKLNHAHPYIMKARYIEEIRKMTSQQRFEKLMAIIEISYLLKATNRQKDILDIEELEKINKKSNS